MIRYIGIGLKPSQDFLSVGADYLKGKLHLVNNQLIGFRFLTKVRTRFVHWYCSQSVLFTV